MWRVAAVVGCLVAFVPLGLGATADRTAALDGVFAPLSRDIAAVSPAGTYLAYTLRESDELFVYVVRTHDPGRAVAKVKVGTKEASQFITPLPPRMTSGISRDARIPSTSDLTWKPIRGKTAPVVYAMKWVGENRVVLSTNLNAPRYTPNGYRNRYGAVLAFDQDGANAKIVATAEELGGVGDFEVLSHQDATVVFKTTSQRFGNKSVVLNVRTGRTKSRKPEVFQKAREDARARASGLSARSNPALLILREEFKDHDVRALSSSDSGTPVAVRISSRGDPGRLGLYFPGDRRLFDLGPCGVEGFSQRARTMMLRTQLSEGDAVESLLTFAPRPVVGSKPRLAVLCPKRFTAELQKDYRRDVLTLVQLGFDVLEVGGRRQDKLEQDNPAQGGRYIFEVAEIVRRRYGIGEAKVAIFGIGASSCDAARSLIIDVGIPYRCAVLFEPRITRSNADVIRQNRGARGASEAEPQDAARLLCLYTAGAMPISDRHGRAQAEEYCDVFVRSRKWFVDYSPVPFAASRLQHEEELLALYSSVGVFLDEALREGQVELGPVKSLGEAPRKHAR